MRNHEIAIARLESIESHFRALASDVAALRVVLQNDRRPAGVSRATVSKHGAVLSTFSNNPQPHNNDNGGVLAMRMPGSIREVIKFEQEFPDLEVAVTGTTRKSVFVRCSQESARALRVRLREVAHAKQYIAHPNARTAAREALRRYWNEPV